MGEIRSKTPSDQLAPPRHRCSHPENLFWLRAVLICCFVGCAGAGAGADDADSMGRPAAASPGRHRSAPPKNTCRKTLHFELDDVDLWCAVSAFGCGPPSSRRPATSEGVRGGRRLGAHGTPGYGQVRVGSARSQGTPRANSAGSRGSGGSSGRGKGGGALTERGTASSAGSAEGGDERAVTASPRMGGRDGVYTPVWPPW